MMFVSQPKITQQNQSHSIGDNLIAEVKKFESIDVESYTIILSPCCLSVFEVVYHTTRHGSLECQNEEVQTHIQLELMCSNYPQWR